MSSGRWGRAHSQETILISMEVDLLKQKIIWDKYMTRFASI